MAKRLSKLAKELNVGTSTLVEFLHKKGYDVDSNPNYKLTEDQQHLLETAFSTDYNVKKQSEKLNLGLKKDKKETLTLDDMKHTDDDREDDADDERVLHIKDSNIAKVKEPKKSDEISGRREYKVIGKIDLDDLSGKKKTSEKIHTVEKEVIAVEAEVEKKVENITTVPQTDKQPVVNSEPLQEKVVEQNTSFAQTELKETNNTQKEDVLIKEDKTVKKEELSNENPNNSEIKVVGKINLDELKQKNTPEIKGKKRVDDYKGDKTDQDNLKNSSDKKTAENKAVNIEHTVESGERKEDFLATKFERLSGPTVVGKIELPDETSKKKQPIASSTDKSQRTRRRRRRNRIKKGDEIAKPGTNQVQKETTTPTTVTTTPGANTTKPQTDVQRKTSTLKVKRKVVKKTVKKAVDDEDVQKQIKETLARLTAGRQKNKGAKHRRVKRDMLSKKQMEELEKQEQEKKVLKVTEFVSVNEIANMMEVSVTDVISTCMSLGLFVAINQRLDAETIALVAEEFDYEVEFVSVELQEAIEEDEEEDEEGDLTSRAPIVTVMGHVDHGKTSLLDYIRRANVIAGEAGGITQHIGAYNVQLENGKAITFLDTPGHEAFTAMRARGAKVTDIAIIVVAADDSVMPQTIEAINHASAAGVPIVFAINKIDKPSANPEKIKEQLANMNYLVEDWGGKFQSQDISAKQGLNVEELLEKVLLEAEMLELRANKNRRASGSVVESSLDKGRGYVATILVATGTLKVGDVVLAGTYTGRVKAMYNERNKRIEEAGPSEPALILGLNGAPQAGDKFNVMESEKEAKDIANKRNQLQREQGLRAQKHITLDEIGRRIAIGNFKELNVIVKGDVDGSIEALSDSLIRLSTDEIQVNIIHKAVGQIIESDVMLAAASNAIIIGFQVRPSVGARRLAENEGIDIRLYSIIYDAINELKDAMQGMLSPELKEEILGTAEIREVFKISKVGTVAGCIVRDGKIVRNSRIRIIREGIVVFTGELGSLKRFKEDVKEVKTGFECGLNIERFNDLKEADIIEAFHEIEVERTL